MCFIWVLGSPFQAELGLLGYYLLHHIMVIYLFGHDVCDLCVAK